MYICVEYIILYIIYIETTCWTCMFASLLRVSACRQSDVFQFSTTDSAHPPFVLAAEQNRR